MYVCSAKRFLGLTLLFCSPAIVANLWDVTDKDIDRFLTRLLKEWIEQRGNILNYVSTARDECFLPYLIGASPVVYGLPLVCQFN